MIIFLAGNTVRITPCHKVTISCYLCVVFMYQYLDTMVYDYRFVDTVNTIKDITVLTSKALIHNCGKSKIRFQMLKMRSTLRKIYVMISMYLFVVWYILLITFLYSVWHSIINWKVSERWLNSRTTIQLMYLEVFHECT